MLLARCVNVFVKHLILFPIVLFESKGKPTTLWECFLWYFNHRQRSFGPRYVLIRLKNFNSSFNKREIPPLCSNNWIEGRDMSVAQSANQTYAQTDGRKCRPDALRPRSRRRLKQKRQQRRLNNDLIFNLWISWEFKFTRFVYHCQI